jgi:hypothetical protein
MLQRLVHVDTAGIQRFESFPCYKFGMCLTDFMVKCLNCYEHGYFFGTEKASCTLSVKPNNFTVWRHTWRKKWANCAVLTDNSAELRTVLSSRLSHRELRSSLQESHSFLNLSSDFTMASLQDTQPSTSVSSNLFSRWASHDIFLFKYHFLLHVLRFLFFFSDNYRRCG